MSSFAANNVFRRRSDKDDVLPSPALQVFTPCTPAGLDNNLFLSFPRQLMVGFHTGHQSVEKEKEQAPNAGLLAKGIERQKSSFFVREKGLPLRSAPLRA
jgi:hypothetical protein